MYDLREYVRYRHERPVCLQTIKVGPCCASASASSFPPPLTMFLFPACFLRFDQRRAPRRCVEKSPLVTTTASGTSYGMHWGTIEALPVVMGAREGESQQTNKHSSTDEYLASNVLHLQTTDCFSHLRAHTPPTALQPSPGPTSPLLAERRTAGR